ncbi:hypothetical protein [Methylobacterium sp. 092160098-2]|jgi:hypothetical protein|uniref:hypothetical protein n=1 Tax=Methylobacterium sp. 092160098-2 TaxID=3025129 RepID=UPI002381C89F|nr:hypothetical protein [Methylobacterium sp. 092160098-2]MDE4914882.1 hypothetical protein [Methylobacterium sp. 092160098-2]
MVTDAEFVPFADDAAALEIDGLKFENGTDAVALYGSVSFTRDAVGRNRLARVLAVLDRLRAVMDEGALPDAVGGDEAQPTVANPFD